MRTLAEGGFHLVRDTAEYVRSTTSERGKKACTTDRYASKVLTRDEEEMEEDGGEEIISEP
jgi:hypothetical protein